MKVGITRFVLCRRRRPGRRGDGRGLDANARARSATKACCERDLSPISAPIVQGGRRFVPQAMGRRQDGAGGSRRRPDAHAAAVACPVRHGPVAGRNPPIRGPAERGAGQRNGWTRLLARPPLHRLPGRAVRPGLRRHRGRAVHPLPPPAIHRLAQRRAAREPPVRRPGPRHDRRPGPLDRPSRRRTSSP